MEKSKDRRFRAKEAFSWVETNQWERKFPCESEEREEKRCPPLRRGLKLELKHAARHLGRCKREGVSVLSYGGSAMAA